MKIGFLMKQQVTDKALQKLSKLATLLKPNKSSAILTFKEATELRRQRRLAIRSQFKLERELEKAILNKFGEEEGAAKDTMANVDRDYISITQAYDNWSKSISIDLALESETKRWNISIKFAETVDGADGKSRTEKTDFLSPYTNPKTRETAAVLTDLVLQTLPPQMEISLDTRIFSGLTNSLQYKILAFWAERGFSMNAQGRYLINNRG